MKRLPPFAARLALVSCVLGLAACTNTINGFVEDIKFHDWMANAGPPGSTSENLLADGCPKTDVVPDLGSFTEFTDNTKPGARNLVSTARISAIESKCQYSSQSVTVDIRLAFDGTLGPAGRSGAGGGNPTFSYPFFVAVTSPAGTILAKEVFAANMMYNTGTDTQTYSETMRQIIPVPSKQAGGHYKILAGFQLAPEQLNYNRAVIAADDAARREKEKIRKAADAAAKKNASTEPPAEVVIVPDTTAPLDMTVPPQLGEPINIAPAAR